MANYDTAGLTYDSGVLYDATFLPTGRRKKIMPKVKFSLDGLSDAQVIQRCTSAKTALTGNAAFTTPIPSLTTFGGLITTAQTKLTTSDNAAIASKQATADKDDAIAALKQAASQLATYVELTAAGDENKIMSAGMDVRASRVPASAPGTVMNLSITAGDNAGELDLQWDPLSTANRYEAQLCAASDFATGVINLPSTSKSTSVANGLTTGTRMWARIRALNAAGPGAWSDVATKIVP